MLNAIRRRFVKAVSRIYDPLIPIKIGNQNIKIPLSHDLSAILKLYPDYNFNLARIVSYINSQVVDVKVIDIGANVGDTVAFIKNFSDVPLLCIDGEAKYMKILKENTKQYKNVYACQTLVGAETKDVKLRLVSEKGTAYVVESGDAAPMRTLENILVEFPEFKKSKLIKTDTDGFDSIILRSCKNYLENVCPVIFFEFDPHLIKKNNDDAFDFMNFLMGCGYYYFIFYTNIGDYLVSCNAEQKDLITELIHYFSGRKLELFADVCAFVKADSQLFEKTVIEEIKYFKNIRNY